MSDQCNHRPLWTVIGIVIILLSVDSFLTQYVLRSQTRELREFQSRITVLEERRNGHWVIPKGVRNEVVVQEVNALSGHMIRSLNHFSCNECQSRGYEYSPFSMSCYEILARADDPRYNAPDRGPVTPERQLGIEIVQSAEVVTTAPCSEQQQRLSEHRERFQLVVME